MESSDNGNPALGVQESSNKVYGELEHQTLVGIIESVRETVKYMAPILERDRGIMELLDSVATATMETIRERLKDFGRYVLELERKFIHKLDVTISPNHPDLQGEEKEKDRMAAQRRVEVLSQAANALDRIFKAIQTIATNYFSSPFDVDTLLAEQKKLKLIHDADRWVVTGGF
ncbi:MAG: hypothetical protein Q7S16_05095 [bacterium]|nr:hypothetical protein [bacterium]